jgi:hypothetical protein
MRYSWARFSAEDSGAVPFTALSMSHSMREAMSWGAGLAGVMAVEDLNDE